MFCDLSSLRRSSLGRSSLSRWAPHCLTTGALLAAVLLLTAGCGHKKSPIPPPSKVPQKVDFSAHQRGQEAIVSFPFPTTTISGTLLPGVSKIEVWRYAVEVPEFAVELLAQEDLARKEAQALLDELGLPLVEAPLVTDPNADPPGVLLPTDPLAPEAGMPALPTDPMSDSKTALPGVVSATTTPQENVDSAPTDDSDLDEESAGEGSAEEGSGDTEPTGDETDTEGAGAEGETEGAEIELTEEEQLALRVKAARTLLLSPPTPKSSFISATTKDFKNGSEIVLSLEGDEVPNSLIGDRIALRLTLPLRPNEGPEIGFLFAVKVFALNGKPSDFSATKAVLPSDTPPPPGDVAIEAQAAGIYIRWSAEEDPPAGFRIYRRDAQTRLYGEPIANLTLGTERFYLDRQAIFGARYIYGLTSLETASPLLESDLSSEHEIDYQDRFGPAIPGGLVAFPEAGRVRLLWTTVADADVAGYEVSRRAGSDTEATLITSDLVTRGQYLDESVAKGEVWFYSVVAVDTSGNRSLAGAETEVRVP